MVSLQKLEIELQELFKQKQYSKIIFEITTQTQDEERSSSLCNLLGLSRISNDKKNIQGFRKIEAGPANKPYDRFCVAPGHQLGFNELKAIEISNFVKSINNEIPEPFNFSSGHRIQKLVDTIHRSSRQKSWLRV